MRRNTPLEHYVSILPQCKVTDTMSVTLSQHVNILPIEVVSRRSRLRRRGQWQAVVIQILEYVW